MYSYHNVAELRQFRGGTDHESDRSPAAFRLMARWSRRLSRLAPAAVDLDVQIADFLPQCIAVEAEQVGGAALIATGRGQRRGQERHLDFLEDAVIEAGRRHAVREAREVRGQIGLDRAA